MPLLQRRSDDLVLAAEDLQYAATLLSSQHEPDRQLALRSIPVILGKCSTLVDACVTAWLANQRERATRT